MKLNVFKGARRIPMSATWVASLNSALDAYLRAGPGTLHFPTRTRTRTRTTILAQARISHSRESGRG